MHASSMTRMKWFAETYLSSDAFPQTDPISVLDIGSSDVNGTYRSLFPQPRFHYVGLDMANGSNVDIVAETPYAWTTVADESFDVVISGQAFEHIEFFWLTLDEMARVLKRGGLLCITAPYKCERHRYPADCYRFDTDGMLALAKYENFTPLHVSADLACADFPGVWFQGTMADALLVAKKPLDWSARIDPATYQFKEIDVAALSTGMTGRQ